MSRFFPNGVPVVVMHDDAFTPSALVYEQYRHEVAILIDRFEIEHGWWRRLIGGEPIKREYFLVRTQSGLRLELFRTLGSPSCWFVERIYD